MKKNLLFIAIITFSFASAQKGTVLVAGDIGFNTRSKLSGEDYSSSGYTIAPRVGYQFSDRMTVGVDLGFGNKTRQSTSTSFERKTNEFNFGAFLRYSRSLGGVFYAFGDFTIGGRSSKDSDNIPNSSSVTKNGLYIGVAPAIAIDLGKSFWLNFSVGGLKYVSSKADTTDAQTGSSFDFNFGQQVNIGISKNF